MSLKHSILAVLSSGERTGYELTHKVDGSVGFFWSATHQQIYRELSQLEESGWVKHRQVRQKDKPDKKVYRLTPVGLKELTQWVGELTPSAPSKDPLLVKLFVGHLAPSSQLHEEMRRHFEEHSERLRKYREIEKMHFSKPEKIPLHLRFQYLTLRRGITYEEAWLKWAGEAIEFLEAQKERDKPANLEPGLRQPVKRKSPAQNVDGPRAPKTRQMGIETL